MKIEKSKISKALKQIGMFVGKNTISLNTSVIHFKNENKKATIFATDYFCAGRAHFETEEEGLFEFCVNYADILRITKFRASEIFAEKASVKNEFDEEVNGIEFKDGSTTFVIPSCDCSVLEKTENESVIPSANPGYSIDAKSFKHEIHEAGFARDEKNTQSPHVAGVNFKCAGNQVKIASTDFHRVASWNTTQQSISDATEEISAILSPKAVSAINLYEDNDNISMYITDSQVIIVSDSLEAYTPKLNGTYPDVYKFFGMSLRSEYEVSSKEVNESLGIMEGMDIMYIKLLFHENKIELKCSANGKNIFSDEISCKRISGIDETISLDPKYFSGIFKNVDSDKINLGFIDAKGNGSFMVLSYSTEGGARGIIAPKV